MQRPALLCEWREARQRTPQGPKGCRVQRVRSKPSKEGVALRSLLLVGRLFWRVEEERCCCAKACFFPTRNGTALSSLPSSLLDHPRRPRLLSLRASLLRPLTDSRSRISVSCLAQPQSSASGRGGSFLRVTSEFVINCRSSHWLSPS